MLGIGSKWLGPLTIISRIVLSVILALAAITKITDFDELQITVSRSMLIPPAFDRTASVLIIAIELVLACGLLMPKAWRTFALGYSFFFATLFGYSLWRWYQDINAPCGCFGMLFRLTPWQSAGITTLLCLISAILRASRLGALKGNLSGTQT